MTEQVFSWLLGLLTLLVAGLVRWVWSIERRLTTADTVLYGHSNSSSVVKTLEKVTERLDEHGKLIQALITNLERSDRAHEAFVTKLATGSVPRSAP